MLCIDIWPTLSSDHQRNNDAAVFLYDQIRCRHPSWAGLISGRITYLQLCGKSERKRVWEQSVGINVWQEKGWREYDEGEYGERENGEREYGEREYGEGEYGEGEYGEEK